MFLLLNVSSLLLLFFFFLFHPMYPDDEIPTCSKIKNFHMYYNMINFPSRLWAFLFLNFYFTHTEVFRLPINCDAKFSCYQLIFNVQCFRTIRDTSLLLEKYVGNPLNIIKKIYRFIIALFEEGDDKICVCYFLCRRYIHLWY